MRSDLERNGLCSIIGGRESDSKEARCAQCFSVKASNQVSVQRQRRERAGFAGSQKVSFPHRRYRVSSGNASAPADAFGCRDLDASNGDARPIFQLELLGLPKPTGEARA
jgi:hypothetical protein